MGSRFGCIIPPNPQPEVFLIIQSRKPRNYKDGKWRSMLNSRHRRCVFANINQVQPCVERCSTCSETCQIEYDIFMTPWWWRLQWCFLESCMEVFQGKSDSCPCTKIEYVVFNASKIMIDNKTIHAIAWYISIAFIWYCHNTKSVNNNDYPLKRNAHKQLALNLKP